MASSLSLPVSPVVSHVNEYASATACLSFPDIYGMDKLVETCKLFMKNKCMGFVKKADGRALLASYGSDGTPLITRQHWRQSAGSLGDVHRHGGSSHEYLIQRCFFMYRKSGEAVVDTLFTEPIPLASGRGTVQLFNCARVFFPTLRGAGHKVLSVQHVCFDRGCYSALSRMLRELHTLQYEPGYLPFSDDGQRALAKATDWFVPTPCCNHDCHNALKWSLSRYVLAEVAKDMFIVFESLRNAFDLLMERLHGWVSSRATFTTREGSVDEFYQFWVALGVDSEFATALAELGLCFKGGQLLIDMD